MTGARGRTTITPRVAERLAARAAAEVVGGNPRAEVDLDGIVARLRVHVEIPYPGPVRPVAADVRRRVVEVVAALADLDAREVDVVVDALTVGPARRGRVR